MNTCEEVNYMHRLLLELDWNKFWKKDEQDFVKKHQGVEEEKVEIPKLKIYEGNVFKLHGSIVHSERKTTFQQFDHTTCGVLFASDVASRGLDFKNVQWVVQFDLIGQLKEYANRIGRTA